MTEKPAVLVWGDAIQDWSERWRTADPADVDAAVAEGVSLCDAVIGWATPLLANAAARPPSADHLKLLRAILGTWLFGARRAVHMDGVTPSAAFAAAVDNARAMIHTLAAAEATAIAARPPRPTRGPMTTQEIRDGIRLRRAMGG